MTREEFIKLPMGSLIYNKHTLMFRKTVSQFTNDSPLSDESAIWTRDPMDESSGGLDIPIKECDCWIPIKNTYLEDSTPQQIINKILLVKIGKLENALYKLRSIGFY